MCHGTHKLTHILQILRTFSPGLEEQLNLCRAKLLMMLFVIVMLVSSSAIWFSRLLHFKIHSISRLTYSGGNYNRLQDTKAGDDYVLSTDYWCNTIQELKFDVEETPSEFIFVGFRSSAYFCLALTA